MKLKLILIITPLFLASCFAAFVAGGAAGAGTVAYIGGQLSVVEEVGLDRAYRASQSALQELEFKIVKDQKDAFSAFLEASGATSKKITVNLKRQTDRLTEIKIRVGVFGGEAVSRKIHEKIKLRL